VLGNHYGGQSTLWLKLKKGAYSENKVCRNKECKISWDDTEQYCICFSENLFRIP